MKIMFHMHKLGRAKPNDLPAVEKLFRRVDAALVSEGNDMWDRGYPEKADFAADLQDGSLYLLKEGSRVLAMASVSHDLGDALYPRTHSAKKVQGLLDEIGWNGEEISILHRFMVDPAFWGKGLSDEFLAYLFERYKGSTWIFAVYQINEAGFAFYKRKGFSVLAGDPGLEYQDDHGCCIVYKKYRKDGLCQL